jgi:succinoglycan biosynthesis protein ExoM
MSRSLMVAIPSYKRPASLASTLDGVERARARLNSVSPDTKVEVVVLDNDPEQSAQSVVDGRAVRYVPEPSPGLSAVRNRALDEATAADLLVFIDDDEVPEERWLVALVDMFDSSDADAVAGRVVTVLEDDVDPWLSAAGAFVRPHREHGQLMSQAATNNLLLSVETVRRIGVRFDPRFGMSGGEDNLFTLQLTRAGANIRWAQDAVVTENVVPGRVDRAWILTRNFRTGNSSARVNVALARSASGRLRARARDLAGGSARILQGASRWTIGFLTRSLSHRARGTRAIYRGAGYISGAIGSTFNEYGRS